MATTAASIRSVTFVPSTNMPLRKPATPRDKREELKTYHELQLRRDLKSIRARKRVEANGLRRVLGDGSSGQPYLVVETKRYRQVRLEIQRKLLVEARQTALGLSADLLLQQLKPRIEALAYTQLSAETGHDAHRHVTVAALGRALTAEERTRFAASRAASAESGQIKTATSSANRALDQVLGHVEQRQTHNPARYQSIWAELVGADAAQQSFLDNIDAATQTAWFRCSNSSLSYALSRKPALAQKAGQGSGVAHPPTARQVLILSKTYFLMRKIVGQNGADPVDHQHPGGCLVNDREGHRLKLDVVKYAKNVKLRGHGRNKCYTHIARETSRESQEHPEDSKSKMFSPSTKLDGQCQPSPR